MTAPVMDHETVTPIVNVENPSIPFSKFVLRVLIAAAAAAVLLVGGLFMADKMGAFDKVTVSGSAAVSAREPGAKVGYTFGDQWNEIKTPTSESVFTRCDPVRDGFRMFMTTSADLSFQTDALCKKA